MAVDLEPEVKPNIALFGEIGGLSSETGIPGCLYAHPSVTCRTRSAVQLPAWELGYPLSQS